MNHKKQLLSPDHIFIIVTVISALFSVFWLIKTHGGCLDALVSAQGNDRFMDFFNHISYVRERANVYFAGYNACFPPLIYLMYYLFNRILPVDATVMYKAYESSSYALLLYVSYCVILSVILFYSIVKFFQKKRSMEFSLGVTLLIMVSDVWIFGILERGNSAAIACLLLLGAIYLRESENKVFRELALFLIAAAAGVKVYPAVFGLLYLFEKRWKEAGRLLGYGVIFFFSPFVFFGGISGARQFIQNQITLQSTDLRGMWNIRAFWNQIAAEWLHCEPGYTGVVLIILYIFLAVLAGTLTRSVWKRTLLLSGIMILAPFWSVRYTGIYLLIPLVLFIREKREGVMNCVYAFLFACMFLLLTYDREGWWVRLLGNNLPSAVRYLAIYTMNLIIVVEAIKNRNSSGRQDDQRDAG